MIVLCAYPGACPICRSSRIVEHMAQGPHRRDPGLRDLPDLVYLVGAGRRWWSCDGCGFHTEELGNFDLEFEASAA